MSDTTTADTPAETPADGAPTGRAHDRQGRFAAELEAVGHQTSRGDRRLVLAAAAVMAAGVVLAIAAYAMSTSQSDTRDVISSGILAMVGLSLVVAGGAVFVRSSLTEFLRFWMLRMLYENQRNRTEG
jgi:hypothetical protein